MPDQQSPKAFCPEDVFRAYIEWLCLCKRLKREYRDLMAQRASRASDLHREEAVQSDWPVF